MFSTRFAETYGDVEKDGATTSRTAFPLDIPQTGYDLKRWVRRVTSGFWLSSFRVVRPAYPIHLLSIGQQRNLTGRLLEGPQTTGSGCQGGVFPLPTKFVEARIVKIILFGHEREDR